MDTPLLSIVVPVYNAESTLDLLLDAFRQQTETCFEVIFVDDGSEDGSLKLLQDRAEKEPFPMVVHHTENQGVSAARNEGMELARGTYLSFVDADDLVAPEYVEILLDATEKEDFDLYVFQSLRTEKTDSTASKDKFMGYDSVTGLDMLYRVAANPTLFGVYNFFMKRSFLEDHRFQFVTGYAYYEDYDFIYRMLAVAEKILVTEHQLYFYILREGSAVATFRVERLSNIELLRSLVPFLTLKAPDFVSEYENHVIPRIYWSVLWQAALAFSLKDAKRFAKAAKMRDQMQKLKDYSGSKVAVSAKLYLLSPSLFLLAAKVMGRSHSKIEPADVQPFLDYLKENQAD